MKRLSMITLFAALFLSLALSVSAQGTVTGSPLVPPLPDAEAAAYVPNLGGAPAGATVADVFILNGFNTYVVGDTQAIYDRACADVGVYKVSDKGTQDLFSKAGADGSGYSCVGNVLTIKSVGTGHYIVYFYNSTGAQTNTPRVIVGLTVGQP